MLDGLPETDRTAFLAAARRRRFAAGEVVFHLGDTADTLHLVHRGHVAVRRTTRFGDVVTLSILGPGQLFGELGAAQVDGRRSATVVALDPTETWSWDRRAFAALRARHPGVDAALVDLLTAQVVQLTSHLMEALFESAPTRVLRRLLDVCGQYGGVEAGRVVPLTQDDLATMAGTTRPTVNRTLRALEADGVVALGRGRVTILDPEALARLAR
jgi:CRP/FNR family transcriptional regulator, cyclic AMP receptor protein